MPAQARRSGPFFVHRFIAGREIPSGRRKECGKEKDRLERLLRETLETKQGVGYSRL